MNLNLELPINEIMSRATITAAPEATVDHLIELMTTHHIGSIPIVDSLRRPTGIVTKLDLVECRDRPEATAREIMMPHAMTVPADASVGVVAKLMNDERLHHLLVVDDGALCGIVSTFDITRWVAGAS